MQIFGWYLVLALLLPPARAKLPKSWNFFISQISYSLHWPIVAIYTSLIETNGILPLQPFASWGVRFTKSMAPQIATSQTSLLRPVAQSFGRVSMSVFQMAKQAAEPSKDAWHWPIDLSRLSSIQDLSRSFEIVSKLWSYSPPKRLVQRPRCLKCAVDMLRDPHGLWRSLFAGNSLHRDILKKILMGIS